MKIDIYKSVKNGKKYLSVPENTDVTTIIFPNDIDQDLLTLSPFKTNLDIDPSSPRIALDANDVIQQIQKNGYAIHGTEFKIEISTK